MLLVGDGILVVDFDVWYTSEQGEQKSLGVLAGYGADFTIQMFWQVVFGGELTRKGRDLERNSAKIQCIIAVVYVQAMAPGVP